MTQYAEILACKNVLDFPSDQVSFILATFQLHVHVYQNGGDIS